MLRPFVSGKHLDAIDYGTSNGIWNVSHKNNHGMCGSCQIMLLARTWLRLNRWVVTYSANAILSPNYAEAEV